MAEARLTGRAIAMEAEEETMRAAILTAVGALAVIIATAIPAQADPGWPRGPYPGGPGGQERSSYHYRPDPGPGPGYHGYPHDPRGRTQHIWRQIERERAEIRQGMREIRRDRHRGDWAELRRDQAELARDQAQLEQLYRALRRSQGGYPHR